MASFPTSRGVFPQPLATIPPEESKDENSGSSISSWHSRSSSKSNEHRSAKVPVYFQVTFIIVASIIVVFVVLIISFVILLSHMANDTARFEKSSQEAMSQRILSLSSAYFTSIEVLHGVSRAVAPLVHAPNKTLHFDDHDIVNVLDAYRILTRADALGFLLHVEHEDREEYESLLAQSYGAATAVPFRDFNNATRPISQFYDILHTSSTPQFGYRGIDHQSSSLRANVLEDCRLHGRVSISTPTTTVFVQNTTSSAALGLLAHAPIFYPSPTQRNVPLSPDYNASTDPLPPAANIPTLTPFGVAINESIQPLLGFVGARFDAAHITKSATAGIASSDNFIAAFEDTLGDEEIGRAVVVDDDVVDDDDDDVEGEDYFVVREISGVTFGNGKFLYGTSDLHKSETRNVPSKDLFQVRITDGSKRYYKPLDVSTIKSEIKQAKRLTQRDAIPRVRYFAIRIYNRVWLAVVVARPDYISTHYSTAFTPEAILVVCTIALVLGVVNALLLYIGRLGILQHHDLSRERHQKLVLRAFESTISYATHELRNPLQVVIASLDFVEPALKLASSHIARERRRLHATAPAGSFQTALPHERPRREPSESVGSGVGVMEVKDSSFVDLAAADDHGVHGDGDGDEGEEEVVVEEGADEVLELPKGGDSRSQGDAVESWAVEKRIDEALFDIVRAKSSSMKMVEVVNSLVDLEKMAHGSVQINLSPANPREVLVSTVLAAMSEHTGATRLLVSGCVPPVMLLDEARVTEIVRSFISSALLFAPKSEASQKTSTSTATATTTKQLRPHISTLAEEEGGEEGDEVEEAVDVEREEGGSGRRMGRGDEGEGEKRKAIAGDGEDVEYVVQVAATIEMIPLVTVRRNVAAIGDTSIEVEHVKSPMAQHPGTSCCSVCVSAATIATPGTELAEVPDHAHPTYPRLHLAGVDAQTRKEASKLRRMYDKGSTKTTPHTETAPFGVLDMLWGIIPSSTLVNIAGEPSPPSHEVPPVDHIKADASKVWSTAQIKSIPSPREIVELEEAAKIASALRREAPHLPARKHFISAMQAMWRSMLVEYKCDHVPMLVIDVTDQGTTLGHRTHEDLLAEIGLMPCENLSDKKAMLDAAYNGRVQSIALRLASTATLATAMGGFVTVCEEKGVISSKLHLPLLPPWKMVEDMSNDDLRKAIEEMWGLLAEVLQDDAKQINLRAASSSDATKAVQPATASTGQVSFRVDSRQSSRHQEQFRRSIVDIEHTEAVFRALAVTIAPASTQGTRLGTFTSSSSSSAAVHSRVSRTSAVSAGSVSSIKIMVGGPGALSWRKSLSEQVHLVGGGIGADESSRKSRSRSIISPRGFLPPMGTSKKASPRILPTSAPMESVQLDPIHENPPRPRRSRKSRAMPGTPSSPATPTSPPLHLHVLIVDDDHFVRRLLQRFVESIGCTTECLEDGDQVEPLLVARGQLPPIGGGGEEGGDDGAGVVGVESGKTKFGLILMDIVMQRSDGASITRHLVCDRGLMVPVVAITANHAPYDIKRYKTCGFRGIAKKPVTVVTLRTVIQRALDGETW